MDRQRWLPFEHYEQLDMLWAQFPEVGALEGREAVRPAHGASGRMETRAYRKGGGHP